MKIILTAFGGKLRSEVQEWPEETPPDIRLPMTIGRLEAKYGDTSLLEVPNKQVVGYFQATRMSYPLSDGDFAKEYVLVGIS